MVRSRLRRLCWRAPRTRSRLRNAAVRGWGVIAVGGLLRAKPVFFAAGGFPGRLGCCCVPAVDASKRPCLLFVKPVIVRSRTGGEVRRARAKQAGRSCGPHRTGIPPANSASSRCAPGCPAGGTPASALRPSSTCLTHLERWWVGGAANRGLVGGTQKTPGVVARPRAQAPRSRRSPARLTRASISRRGRVDAWDRPPPGRWLKRQQESAHSPPEATSAAGQGAAGLAEKQGELGPDRRRHLLVRRPPSATLKAHIGEAKRSE